MHPANILSILFPAMKGLRLQYQIALAAFLPMLLSALLSVLLGIYALDLIPRNLILERQVALAEVAAAGVVGKLQGHRRLLETTAADLGRAYGDMNRQQAIVRDREQSLDIFDGGVFLLDVRGTVIAATSAFRSQIGQNYATRGDFIAVIQSSDSVYSTVRQAEDTDLPVVILAAPTLFEGALVGVAAGRINLAPGDWARELDLLRTPTGGRAYLIDSAGAIIYHPDSALIGASIRQDAALWAMAQANRSQSAILHYPASAVIKESIRGDSRVLRAPPTAQAANSEDGRALVIAVAPLPGIPWDLVVEEPWQAILATIAPYQWTLAGLMALGLTLSLLSLLLSLRRVTRPLQALVTEGQRVAEGGDFHPLSLEGPPDLRVLLDIVNQMVARLSEQQETLRRYARRILQGQEDERKRLSRELHDETVQDLVALNQRIELTHNALERDPQEAQTRLAELQSLAQRAVTEVRRMSNNLRPSILEDLGLAPALQTLTGELMQAAPGIQANCEIVGAETRLPPDLELVAYRIAQEALNNIRRHAKTATRVNVALFYEGWGIMLMIEDDGPGFEPEELPESGHLGLVGMKERAQIFGGELKIQAAPGEGTTVALRLPTNNKTPGLV